MYSDVFDDACEIQEESQKHVNQECIKLNENQDSMFIYEKIYNESVSEKVEIAKQFEKDTKNYRSIETYKEKKMEKYLLIMIYTQCFGIM